MEDLERRFGRLISKNWYNMIAGGSTPVELWHENDTRRRLCTMRLQVTVQREMNLFGDSMIITCKIVERVNHSI